MPIRCIMSAIKDFFKKKKVEAQFKLAGSGHKLGDASTSQAASTAAAAAAARSQHAAAPRQHPSASAQQAGAAALNRVAATQDRESVEFQRARQRALIKEQARKELEREQQVQAELEDKIQTVYGRDREPEVREAPEQLAAQGILFKCPLVGEESLPRDQMRTRIREFLYTQLSQEQGLTAVLIIHTCNSPRERVETAIETLSKALNNIILNPTEEKYRKIRRNNRVFKEKVGSLEGTEDFLLGCGFKLSMLPVPDGPDEEFWVLSEATDIDHLAMMKESLISAEPVSAELDRDLKIFSPGSGNNNSIGALPPDFFSVTAEEVKREQRERTDIMERESMLRTKAMREKEAAGGQRKYRYCLVRIRFPDGYLIQGTFAVSESFQAVLEFVQEQLETPLPFLLVDSVSGKKLASDTASLQELGLVPASVLNFSWSPDIEEDMKAAGAGKIGFLKNSLLTS